MMEPEIQQNSGGNMISPPSASTGMKKILTLVLVLLLVGAGYFYFSANKDPQITGPIYEEELTGNGRHEEITVESKGNLGIATTAGGEKYLVDRDGMALYYNTADASQVGSAISWSCRGGCERTWNPYLVDEASIALSHSTDPLLRNLNTFLRDWDGRRQYALNSKLLYRFRGDKVPGDMGGENFAEGWVIARP
jgi:predicted lipoprotein with Yx(FWY)xxD motif